MVEGRRCGIVRSATASQPVSRHAGLLVHRPELLDEQAVSRIGAQERGRKQDGQIPHSSSHGDFARRSFPTEGDIAPPIDYCECGKSLSLKRRERGVRKHLRRHVKTSSPTMIGRKIASAMSAPPN